MRHSTWIAVGLFAAVAAWLASGLVSGGGEEGEEAASPAGQPQPTLVEAKTSTAERVPQYIYAQGVAEPYRTVEVVSPAGGTLDEVLAQQGDEVDAGVVLARVRPEERESQVTSAQARVDRLEADLASLRELRGGGFATDAQLRELEAQLEEARAGLQSARSAIQDTTIEAPISGTISDVFVNDGQTVGAGAGIARVVDNTPLRATLHISQRDVGRVDVGRPAVVSFATGQLAKGRLCFVAPAADPETRTFRTEIRVPNDKRSIPSVVSVEVRFQTGETAAHFVSPAILALNEAGALGVKSVDERETVQFHPIEVVRTERDGIWVTGLPEELRLITTGQGFVRQGERVRVSKARERDEAAPAGAATQAARVPTATVEAEEFDEAEDLPDPAPAEKLCQGSGANSVLTNSVPAGSGSAGVGTFGESGAAPPTGGGPGDARDGEAASGGTGAGQIQPQPQSQAAPPSIGPISPQIPSPQIAPPQGQTSGGATGGAGAPGAGGSPPVDGGEAGGGAGIGGGGP